MIINTKGIVLRTVKYGETSVIVSVFTEAFGIQSYLVNGVRKSTKKGPGKANLFQPAAILEMVVYHNELRNLQRLKEFRWGYLYKRLYFNVVCNSVALFMVELVQKCLKQPEPHEDLFHFMEDALMLLDESDETVIANFPLFFALHLAGFFGFRISDEYDDEHTILDLQQGYFVRDQPIHPYFLEGQFSQITSQLLKVRLPHELQQLRLNQETRRILLQAYQQFFALHVPDFGNLRTVAVLQAVL